MHFNEYRYVSNDVLFIGVCQIITYLSERATHVEMGVQLFICSASAHHRYILDENMVHVQDIYLLDSPSKVRPTGRILKVIKLKKSKICLRYCS